MSNVFSNCPRSFELHSPSRRGHQSDTELSSRTPPTIPHSISMASSKRSSSLPPIIRNSQLWFGNHSSPPPYSQSNRDFSPLQSLVLPCKPAIYSDVHETAEIPKTPESEQQLLPPVQLSAHSSRHHTLSHHFNSPPKHFSRLHARRTDVLQSSSNTGSLPQLSHYQLPLLQSDSPSRVRLHRSVSPTCPLPVLNIRANSSLHPGRPQRRQLQSAPARPRLAQDSQHPLKRVKSLREQTGLLGPCPLSTHSEKSPPSSPCPPIPPSTLHPKSLRPSQSRTPRVEKPKRLLPTSSERSASSVSSSSSCKCPGILQNPGMPRASLSHLPSSTSSSPPRASPSVQCPLHLHSGSSHTSYFRPCRLRQNSKQQSRVLMGHSECLGQSPDFRSHERTNPPPCVLRVLSQPLPETETPFSSTLEKIPYPFFSCDFDFGYFSSAAPHQVSNTPSPASLLLPSPKTASFPNKDRKSIPSKEVSSKRAHSGKKFLHSYPNRSWQRPSPSTQDPSLPCPYPPNSPKISNPPGSSKRPPSKSFYHHSSSSLGSNLHSRLAPSILGTPPSTDPRSLPHQHASLPIPFTMGFATDACREPTTLPPLPPSRPNKLLHIPSDTSADDSSYLSASSASSCESSTTKFHSKLSSRIRASNRLGFLLHSSPFLNYSSDSSSSS
uniref:Movement protein n=1 Tax=Andean potato latent virus TaxID=73819 RepID=A0A8F8QTQ7_9VIRU|nr:movement protein [Andean potato latent virus]